MKKLKKTYSFALWTSIYLALSGISVAALLYFLFFENYQYLGIVILFILIFLLSFLIIQYRVERFIYARIKKIYEKVAILNIDDFNPNTSVKDIESLSKSVQDYVEGKRIEIQNLTERDSFRRDFLGNVSHELKTPLFMVQGYILTLIEGAVKDKMIRDKYLERANKGVERLVSIVKDLDMIAKLETHGVKMNKEVFNILEIIQNVFDLFEMRAKKRNITLRFDKIYEFPVFVKGDVERIEQVLINLVMNSIKYGKTNGITTIGIDSYNEKKIIIKVIDNGEVIKQ